MKELPVVFLSRRTDQPLYESWRKFLRRPILDVNEFDRGWFPSEEVGVVVSHDAYRRETHDIFVRLTERRIPTLILADGILEYRNSWEQEHRSPAGIFNPVLGHKLACIGPSQCRFVESWGNAGKCENVGMPRLDDFNVPPPPLKEPPSILVCSARKPWFSEADKKLVVQSMQELQETASDLEKKGVCKFVWRLTDDLQNILGYGSRDQVPLVQDMAEAHAVISTPSTIVIEAMKTDRPVAVMDYTNSPPYVQSAWSFNHKGMISQVIADLLDPPRAKLGFQQTVLRDCLQIDEPASPRLARLVERMADEGERCKSSGAPLVLPERILD